MQLLVIASVGSAKRGLPRGEDQVDPAALRHRRPEPRAALTETD